MNNAAITRQALLEAAQGIVRRDGLSALSIRRLAAQCEISVGCIYNYFPSKSELVFALAEAFWKDAARESMKNEAPERFDRFVEATYSRLHAGLEGFRVDFLRQLSTLSLDERNQGRALEAQVYAHMTRGLLRALEADASVSPALWQRGFTREELASFVFTAMLGGLKAGEPDCRVLLALLRKSLYDL